VPEPDENDREHEKQSPRNQFKRIDSDPLDSTGDIDEALPKVVPKEKARIAAALPTLPRYPIAETKNHNCWSEPHAGKCFKVRGPKYFVDKKKISSGAYVFPARGADLILTNPSTSTGVDIALNHSVLGGRVRSMPTL
jgi:hypothetical protein